jgi:hypothetical protein
MAMFLVEEEGPFSIFAKFREFARPKQELNSGGLKLELFFALQCVWCTSVWMTLLATGLWFLEPWIVRVIAAMAVTILITKLSD